MIKISISLPYYLMKHARARAVRLAKERGGPFNFSAYMQTLVKADKDRRRSCRRARLFPTLTLATADEQPA